MVSVSLPLCRTEAMTGKLRCEASGNANVNVKSPTIEEKIHQHI